jgi:cobalt-zinc-cadmium efflux system membrane fusion protein
MPYLDIRMNVVRSAATLVLFMALVVASACSKKEEEAPKPEEPANAAAATPSEVKLSPEALKAAGVQIETVGERAASASMRFTATVEANQQATQQVTPLVSGRVDRVNAALGDRVRAGSVLAVISSPEVAEMHGKLLEARAKQSLAASTLKRTRRLAELGATAGKDVAAAEAEMQTSEAEIRHLENSLKALGAVGETAGHNIAAAVLHAPITGVITERNVNPGAGVEPGKPLFTVANLSTVWVIANVPESQIGTITQGAAANVHAAALRDRTIRGTVSYIDPNLHEETRSARVRVSVANPDEVLKVGMFCQVDITPNTTATTHQLMVPEAAIQRLGEKSVVFVDQGSGTFAVREITVGEKVDDHRLVLSGIAAGDRVATNGSFILKSQLLKSEFAEGD